MYISTYQLSGLEEKLVDLKGRDFLTLLDYEPEEIEYLIDLAKKLKDDKKKRSHA